MKPGQRADAVTTWVHVPTLMQWERPPVGILRTEREYCAWLLDAANASALSGPVRFCVCDPAAGCFTEVAAGQVAARLAGQRGETPSGPGETPRVDFGQGDVFVSLGLDWEYLDQELLYRVKHERALRVALICYDVIPVILPHLFAGALAEGRFAAYIADLAWCADIVMCISVCTRRDLETVLDAMGAPRPPMCVIQLGDRLPPSPGVQELPPEGLARNLDPRPFVLYVSTIERRKNHELLYRAWVRLRERGVATHRLVFVGMRGWGVNELMDDLRLDPRIQGDITILEHVTDDELHWLYRNCAFTVFPSLYEGWGLPLVESLAHGKHCIASDAGSLLEAGGPLAEYLDPWDLPAWTQRLQYWMEHPDALRERSAMIAQQLRPLQWAEAAAAIQRIALGGQPGSEPA